MAILIALALAYIPALVLNIVGLLADYRTSAPASSLGAALNRDTQTRRRMFKRSTHVWCLAGLSRARRFGDAW